MWILMTTRCLHHLINENNRLKMKQVLSRINNLILLNKTIYDGYEIETCVLHMFDKNVDIEYNNKRHLTF